MARGLAAPGRAGHGRAGHGDAEALTRRRQLRRAAAVAQAAAVVLAAGTAAGGSTARADARAAAGPGVVFPLKISTDRRYLVDRRNKPFLVIGDSPQALIGKLSVKEAAAFLANRRAAGFNALWVHLLCADYVGCPKDGTTYDGIKPFTKPGDLSTPNPAYFARADAIIRLAEKEGIVLFLDPIETGSWLGVLRDNGVDKARTYGRFLGRHYKSFGNIVWSSGNDFQTWRDQSDDDVVLAVAKGIRSVDRAHLQTVELNYFKSSSLDDARWRSVIQLDSAYTYYPTYAEVLQEYNRKQFMPVFMAEAGYEFEQNNPSISKGDPPILRRQEYWSALAGSTGQFYGNKYTWQFIDGWKEHLDTPGSAQLGLLAKLFGSLPWYRLVPDQAHKVVTAGYGTFASDGNVGSSNYVTTASTSDGTLSLSYLPAGGTIVVNTRRLARPLEARWFDPTNGKLAAVEGSPFAKAGKVRFTAPGRNGDGDRDWLLVLTGR